MWCCNDPVWPLCHTGVAAFKANIGNCFKCPSAVQKLDSIIPQLLLTVPNFNFSLILLSHDRRGAAGGSLSSTCYTEPQDIIIAQIFQCLNGGVLGLNCSFCAHCKTSIQTVTGDSTFHDWSSENLWESLAHNCFDKRNQLLGAHTHTHNIIVKEAGADKILSNCTQFTAWLMHQDLSVYLCLTNRVD